MKRGARQAIIALVVSAAALAHARPPEFGTPPRAADPGIAGIEFCKPGTTLSVLGRNPPQTVIEDLPRIYGFPGRLLRYLAADRTQELELFVPPGSINLSVLEAEVRLPRDADQVFPGKPGPFVSSRGIQLGMSRAEVTSILGPPTSSSAAEIRYRIAREDAGDWLAEFFLTHYAAVYRFRENRLVAFRFGFPGEP